MSLDKVGGFQYGSELVNVTADATIPGGLGTFGFDDEGIRAQGVPILSRGILINLLTSRETAHLLGKESNGTMRADGWNRIPLIRMTNINLDPGEWTLEGIIADTEEGLFLSTNRSWSIDDKRINFQFGTEIGWEIKKGKLGAMVKNPTYTGITPQFWNSCDAIANRDHLEQAPAAARALEWVGLPEAEYHLAQATMYLALAPKSNSTAAYFQAKAALEEKGATKVPTPLQDAHRDRQGLGHGEGYLNPHDFPGHWVEQTYLPAELAGARFYEPGSEGVEPELAARWRAIRRKAAEPGGGEPSGK